MNCFICKSEKSCKQYQCNLVLLGIKAHSGYFGNGFIICDECKSKIDRETTENPDFNFFSNVYKCEFELEAN